MSEIPPHLNELRELDFQRYVACLYLPEAYRSAAITLYTFNAEINKIPQVVSEPMPGEIRIQWWRDLIKSGNNVGSGPLANDLVKIINQYQLPAQSFDAFLEAKIFDLYQDPMPDLNTLEGYLGETESYLFQLVAMISGLEQSRGLADACGHSGVAFGIANILSKLGAIQSRGQIHIPLSIIQKHGLDSDKWFAENGADEKTNVLKEVIELAVQHQRDAITAINKLPKEHQSVFLPLAFTKPKLKTVQNEGVAVLSRTRPISPLKTHLTCLKAALFGIS